MVIQKQNKLPTWKSWLMNRLSYFDSAGVFQAVCNHKSYLDILNCDEKIEILWAKFI